MAGLDYSAGRLTGDQIRRAGYNFVVRYVGTPGRAKNITAAEYRDLAASGVAVALVYENVAQDALGGRDGGRIAATAARADADAIGFPRGRPIYLAVDWVATAAQMPAVMSYLDGAADVLGVDRVGVYGFHLTVRTAMDGGHARWFWQCGSRSALVPGTHLYQHNNDSTVVAGIPCDVNDDLRADFGQHNAAPAPATATRRTSEEAVSHIELDPTPAPADPASDPSTWPTRELTFPVAQIGGWHGAAMLQVVFAPYYPHDAEVDGFVRWANWWVTDNVKTTKPRPVGVDDHINDAGAPFHAFWPAKWGPAPDGTACFSLVYAAPAGGFVEIERER